MGICTISGLLNLEIIEWTSAFELISEDATVQLGYSVLANSSALEHLQLRQADGSQQWGWTILRLMPSIVE